MSGLYDAAQRRRDFNGNELDFIHTEIALAMTFLDVADTSLNEETQDRNRYNARKAHEEATVRMEHHTYATQAEQSGAEEALLALTNRLKALP